MRQFIFYAPALIRTARHRAVIQRVTQPLPPASGDAADTRQHQPVPPIFDSSILHRFTTDRHFLIFFLPFHSHDAAIDADFSPFSIHFRVTLFTIFRRFRRRRFRHYFHFLFPFSQSMML